MPDFKHNKRNIIHLCHFILALVAGALWATQWGVGIGGDYRHSHRFCDAAVYGYVIVGTVLFARMFFEEPIGEKTLLLICCGGIILLIIAGLIMLLCFVLNINGGMFGILLLLCAIVTLGAGILYLLEVIYYNIKKREIGEA